VLAKGGLRDVQKGWTSSIPAWLGLDSIQRSIKITSQQNVSTTRPDTVGQCETLDDVGGSLTSGVGDPADVQRRSRLHAHVDSFGGS
jgi:hypothetical protein